ncbi:hypothetical protein [Mesorhizobium marinum]|uniref:hypothetical protein n=1 Tax=Mesorhizobium marinum TaxID=3228790 RepID=UPI003467B72A
MVDEEPEDFGESFGRTFVDKLILALVDAHPEASKGQASDRKRRIERLREAKRALFGSGNPEGRPLDSDETLLRWMGGEHYRDLAKREVVGLNGAHTIRSDRQLVREALAKFGHPESSHERLRKKFGHEKQKWLDAEMLHDDVPEALDHSALTSIQEVLARRGIAMRLDRVER